MASLGPFVQVLPTPFPKEGAGYATASCTLNTTTTARYSNWDAVPSHQEDIFQVHVPLRQFTVLHCRQKPLICFWMLRCSHSGLYPTFPLPVV